jgi:hypothetical protein
VDIWVVLITISSDITPCSSPDPALQESIPPRLIYFRGAAKFFRKRILPLNECSPRIIG